MKAVVGVVRVGPQEVAADLIIQLEHGAKRVVWAKDKVGIPARARGHEFSLEGSRE